MKILVAEDDALSRLILCRALSRLGHDAIAAEDGIEAWHSYLEHAPDVLITDWMMPELDGPDLVRRIRETDRYCYVLMLSALSDDDHAMAGMSAGADGYLAKPLDDRALQLALVAASRMTALHRRLAERESQLEALNARLAEESRRDALTGLGNRRRMGDDLARVEDEHRRYGRHYALALVDVDRFKRFNDQYGHLRGDAALQHVAETLASGVRTSDRVYRYGGEEFLVLLPEQSAEEACGVLERLAAAVSAGAVRHDGNQPRGVLTVSAGVAAVGSPRPLRAESVIAAADAALYEAKRAGRDRVRVAPGGFPPSG